MSSSGEEKESRKDKIELSQKDASALIALALVCGLFLFVGGYFFGKKKMLEEVAERQERDCFLEEMRNSLVGWADDDEKIVPDGAGASPDDGVVAEPGVLQESIEPSAPEPKQEVLAYAQLCGFGTKKAAEIYQNTLKKRLVDSSIAKRTSKNKRGRTVAWYQVVTPTMEKGALEDLVQELTLADKLGDVKIITVNAEKA